MGGAAEQFEVECPRCGYDLSGVARSWERECPLAGECSECALKFEWCDLLNPLRVVPAWSFEHAHGKRVRRLVRTALVCLWPRRLWRQLRMEHPVVGARLAVFGLVVLLALHVACVAASMALVSGVMLHRAWVRADWPARLTWPWDDPPSGWAAGVGTTPGPVAIDPARLMAVGFWPYGNPAAGAPWLFVAMAWCVFVPVAFVALPDTLRKCRVRRVHLVRGLVYSLPWVALIVAFGFVTGTFGRGGWNFGSRRWGATTTGSAYLDLIIEMVNWVAPHPAMCLGLVGLALWAHWGSMVRRYLRLPHDTAVAAAMLVISGLAAMLLGLGLNWAYFGGQLG